MSDSDDNILEHTGETSSALDRILESEFEEAVVKFSSFLSIIHDKKLTNMAVFSLVLKDRHVRNAFKQLTQLDNDRIIVQRFCRLYPNFCKSKVVKKLVEQYVD
jgi:hypothetical protein